jgi:hypothetical protein
MSRRLRQFPDKELEHPREVSAAEKHSRENAASGALHLATTICASLPDGSFCGSGRRRHSCSCWINRMPMSPASKERGSAYYSKWLSRTAF